MVGDNTAQKAYWNESPGQRWVEFQYELDSLHGEVADLVIGSAALQPGERVLDIGCGSGETCLMAAAEVAPGGTVLGLDISVPLVEIGNQRITDAGVASTSIAVADVQHYQLDGSPYDCLISRFGVMFFDDPVAAFANMRQLLRPGGRAVMACWAAAEHNPWFRLPSRIAADRLGPLPPADPDDPGPLALCRPERMERILADAGFSGITINEVDLHLSVPGGLDGARRLVPYVGPVARFLKAKESEPEDLTAILDEIAREFASFLGPDGLRIPARVNLATATA